MNIRSWSCFRALGFLALGCSSQSESSSMSQMPVPSFMGDRPNLAAGGGPTAAPGAVPPDRQPGTGGSSANGSASETREDVPLMPQGDMDPPGDSEPDDEPGEDNQMEPPVTEPPVTEPPVTEPPVTEPPAQLETVLLFTRTTGFRHDSIEPGVTAIQRLGQQNGFAVERTELPADFNDERLARYDVVVWLNTDSEVLNDPARRAFERYIRAGGGWVGVHAAAASEYDWTWYGQLLGGAAYFLGHPAVQPARVQVEIGNHPSTAHLAQSFTLTDEWYSFRANPRASVQVLMTLAENSYGAGDLAMGDHPIAWYHEFDGGRAWYTALGHPNSLYSDPLFTEHVLGGIRWAAGVAP